jgi:hypothetical protein
MGFIKKSELSQQEKIVLLYFQQLTGETIFHFSIKNTLQHADNEGFRSLCDGLISQSKDNPSMMKNILGEGAYYSLMQLKPQPAL